VGTAQLVSFTVSSAALFLGQSQQLKATATFTNGTQDVTSSANWSVQNPAVAQVSSGGMVTPMALGFTRVLATMSSNTAEGDVAVKAQPRFAFLANDLNDSVSIYTIDVKTGLLQANGYVYTGTPGDRPWTTCLTVDPSQQFAYAINSEFGSGLPPNIRGYSFDKNTGQLAQLPGAPVSVGFGPSCLVFEPQGKFAYIASGNNVSAFSLDPLSGALTEIAGSPFASGDTAIQLAMDPQGRFLYVANTGINTGASTVVGFRIDPATGSLTALSPLPVTNYLNYVSVNPSGDFAYISYNDGTTISAYSIDPATGALTAVSNSTVNPGTNPSALMFSPLGDKAYTVNGFNQTLVTYNVDRDTGLLTPVGSPLPTGQIPLAVEIARIDCSGAFLYVNDNADRVWIYQLDSAGMPSFSRTVPTRKGIWSISVVGGADPVHKTPKFAYVSNGTGQNILGYLIGSDGSLSLLPATPVTGQSAVAIAGTSFSSDLFALSQSEPVMPPASLFSYGVNLVTGGLTAVPSGLDAGPHPKYLAVESSDRFLFTTDGAAKAISMFGNGNGGISGFGSVTTALASGPMAIDPNSRFMFILNPADNSVSVLTVDPNGPSLTSYLYSDMPFPTGSGPVAITTDGVGNFVYVANAGDSSISGYRIDYYDNGALVSVGGAFHVGSSPVALAAEPSGRFLFVADASGNIQTCNIVNYADPTKTGAGALTTASSVAAGGTLTAMSVDSSGQFLYVTQSSGVLAYSIDPATGALTAVPGTQAPASDATGITIKALVQ
jgi:6-phosphogluconolactonase (cycloisomerase 2 family)